MGNRLQLFAPISKVESTPDGGRQVWGFATAEVKDSQGEIIDMPGTVDAFAKWSAAVERDSRGLSRGNVRLQHTSDPVGKVLQWNEGEKTLEDGGTAKGIYVGVRVPPYETRTIGHIDEGILTGFSIGGSYAKRWYDSDAQAYRYVPELAELSLVDRPAVPVATFDVVKSAGGRLEVNAVLLKAEGLDEDARKKLHEQAEERAKKYGISFKDGKGSLTPPKGKPTDEADYGDPVNYVYPIDDAHIRAAVGYFNHEGEREKGDYSEEEWAKIGKRIADAANKLVGEGHEFKDGAIETSKEREEAEKASFAGILRKAASGDQLSHGDIRRLVQAALDAKSAGGPFDDGGPWIDDVYDDHVVACDWNTGKNWSIPYSIKNGEAVLGDPTEVRQVWEPVKPAKEEKAVKPTLTKAADPDDRAVDARIKAVEEALAGIRAAQEASAKTDPPSQGKHNDEIDARIEAAEKALAELKAAQAKDEKGDPDEDDKEDAEKAAQALDLLKGIHGRLTKKAVAISAARRKHLGHAIDHINHAVGNTDAVEDKDHIAMTDGGKPDDDEDDEAAEKAATAALQKAFGAGGDLTKALGPVVDAALQRAGLAKATDVQKIAEDLAKATSELEAVKGQVKEIADTPQQGGPFLGSAAPGLGGAMPWAGMEKQALAAFMDRCPDPVVKDAIGRELAVDMLTGAYGAARTAAGRDPSQAPNAARR